VASPPDAARCGGRQLRRGRRRQARRGRDGTPHDLGSFVWTVNLCLFGTFNVMRPAAAMADTEPDDDGQRGVVVNTASIAAYEGQIGQAAHSAAKGGSSA
jgi:NAD(P)-dependent dehydrogenase (short-subunit alcohol dehydrogenase family)